MSCGEPDAQEWASPVRRAGRGNGPAVTPAPRPGPTLRLGATEATLGPLLEGEPPEADQARLLGVERKPESGQALLQIAGKLLDVGLMLKPQHDIIGVPDDDHLAAGVPRAPLLDP